jgi:predicted nucleic acid-binding protein
MARQSKKAALRPVVFDTDVLIWYFRGNPRANAFLSSVETDRRWISSMTIMELFQGCRNREELTDVQAFVAENISRILHPRTAVSEKAIHLTQEFALSHGLRVIDAVIAASALLHRAILATGNNRHFRFIPGLTIEIFKP